ARHSAPLRAALSRGAARCARLQCTDAVGERALGFAAPSGDGWQRPIPGRRCRSAGIEDRLDRRVVLEGEGLANDATALVLYRFAVAAVGSGLFSLTDAAGTFVLIVVGEIAYGIGLGWLSLRLRRWAHDPRVEVTLSLLTPYVAFLLPAHLGGSGV